VVRTLEAADASLRRQQGVQERRAAARRVAERAEAAARVTSAS
jgi:hypothetical protein